MMFKIIAEQQKNQNIIKNQKRKHKVDIKPKGLGYCFKIFTMIV